MKWAYGVTSVKGRVDTLLPKTLASLAAAGFDAPRLFVDDGVGAVSGYATTVRSPRIRTFGNWMLGLAELYIREPMADRYAIFQDDVLACRNLKRYLEATTKQPQAYWNCIAYPDNVGIAQATGWNAGNGAGLGAQGLVFSNRGAMDLMIHSNIVVRPKDASRGHRGIDGGIVFAMKKVGYTELFHFPSLLGHTGFLSSMGNGTQPHIQFDPAYDPMEGRQYVPPRVAPAVRTIVPTRTPFRKRPK